MLKYFFYITTIIFAILLVGSVVNAGPDVNSMARTIANEATYDTVGVTKDTLFDSIGTVLKAVLSLVGTIFLVLVVMAGISWMTAGGSEEKVEKAMKTIRYASIGMLVVLMAYTLTHFVSKRMVTVTSPVGGSTKICPTTNIKATCEKTTGCKLVGGVCL